MKFASNRSKRNSSNTRRKANFFRPVIEACEPRRMMTAAVNDFAGEYVAFQNGQVLAINIRPTSSTDINYTGDVNTSGVDVRLTATESSSGTLSGNVLASGKKVAFDGSLSGKTLTITFPVAGTTDVVDQVSTTPAPLPPALVSHTRTQFKYSAPASWTVSQGSDGILISSPSGTEQVAVFGTVASGYYTASQIANSEVSAGGTIISSSYLANGLVSSTEYKQVGIGLLGYTRNKTPYVSGQIIETLNFSNAGTNGQTVALLFEVTAPKAQFPAVCPTLIDILSSIQQNTAAKVSKTTVQSKSHVPGLSGSWSTNPAYEEEEDDYIATIQGETLQSEEAVDSSVDSFCNDLLS